jgi:hypothetical protein
MEVALVVASVPFAASGVIGELSFAACASGGVEVEAGAVEIGGEEVAS